MQLISTTPLTQAKVNQLVGSQKDNYECYVEMIQFSGGLELKFKSLINTLESAPIWTPVFKKSIKGKELIRILKEANDYCEKGAGGIQQK